MKVFPQRLAIPVLIFVGVLSGGTFSGSTAAGPADQAGKEKQRRAVQAIYGMGGIIFYNSADLLDPQFLFSARFIPPIPRNQAQPALGDDFFKAVKRIRFQRADRKTWSGDEFQKYGLQATAEELEFWVPWTRENLLKLKPSFESLSDLEYVSFYQTKIPRGGLAAIAGLRKLRSLNLQQTQITSSDLRYLKGLTNLSWLSLRRTRIRDDGLEHLRGLSQLESLSLGSTVIGDRGLEHVAGLTELTELNLENTHVTDDGLKHLRKLTNLQSLQLGLTEVSDRGLRHLYRLRHLRKLVLDKHGISQEGVARLKLNLPQWRCRVTLRDYSNHPRRRLRD